MKPHEHVEGYIHIPFDEIVETGRKTAVAEIERAGVQANHRCHLSDKMSTMQLNCMAKLAMIGFNAIYGQGMPREEVLRRLNVGFNQELDYVISMHESGHTKEVVPNSGSKMEQ